jgi:PKD repeat protein
LPNDFTVCKSIDYTLNSSVAGGTNPYSFAWNNTETGENIDYNLSQNTFYSLTVTDSHGCTGTNDVNISVYDDLVLNAFADFDTVCKGDPVTISCSIMGGLIPYSINVNGNLTSLPTIVYPNNQESYNIEVSDACKYKISEIINLNTYPVPTLSFSADTLQGCPPLNVSFNLTSFENTSNYTWSFGDGGGTYNTLNPTYIYENSGLFDVNVQVTDKNACKNQLTIEDLINIYPIPDAKFEPEQSVVSFINPVINFNNYSNFRNNIKLF